MVTYIGSENTPEGSIDRAELLRGHPTFQALRRDLEDLPDDRREAFNKYLDAQVDREDGEQ